MFEILKKISAFKQSSFAKSWAIKEWDLCGLSPQKSRHISDNSRSDAIRYLQYQAQGIWVWILAANLLLESFCYLHFFELENDSGAV